MKKCVLEDLANWTWKAQKIKTVLNYLFLKYVLEGKKLPFPI